MIRRHRYLLFLAVVFLALTLACGVGNGGPTSPQLTATALSTLLSGNGTPTVNGDTPVDGTPGPEQPPATPGNDGETAATATTAPAGGAAETATRRILEVTETAAARAAATGTAEAALAATVAPIEQELLSLGVDPSQGSLGWVHPPVEIFVEGYLQYDWDIDRVRVVDDFVVAADITWNTQFGSTGCGFVLRSDGNEEAITQYLVIATRGGSGRVLFGTQIDGNLLLDESEDIYANGIDPLFEWQNDTTNRIVVVGRGPVFSIFSNGTHLGDITTNGEITRGLVAFVALNESGTTFCRFDNAYLWQLNPQS